MEVILTLTPNISNSIQFNSKFNFKYCLCPLNLNERLLYEHKLHIKHNKLVYSTGAFCTAYVLGCFSKFQTFLSCKILLEPLLDKVIVKTLIVLPQCDYIPALFEEKLNYTSLLLSNRLLKNMHIPLWMNDPELVGGICGLFPHTSVTAACQCPSCFCAVHTIVNTLLLHVHLIP